MGVWDKYIIVSGLPRSGTSMMMSMLQAGGIAVLTDGKRKPDANNQNGYFELDAVKRLASDPSCVEQARGKALKVVCFLLKYLPPDRLYHVLYLRRNILEVCVSQRKMLVSMGKDPGDHPDAYWQGVLDMQERRIMDWMHARKYFRVLYVDYHRALGYPAQVVEQVESFLDGGLNKDAMIKSVDKDLYHVRSDAGPSPVSF